MAYVVAFTINWNISLLHEHPIFGESDGDRGTVSPKNDARDDQRCGWIMGVTHESRANNTSHWLGLVGSAL